MAKDTFTPAPQLSPMQEVTEWETLPTEPSQDLLGDSEIPAGEFEKSEEALSSHQRRQASPTRQKERSAQQFLGGINAEAGDDAETYGDGAIGGAHTSEGRGAAAPSLGEPSVNDGDPLPWNAGAGKGGDLTEGDKTDPDRRARSSPGEFETNANSSTRSVAERWQASRIQVSQLRLAAEALRTSAAEEFAGLMSSVPHVKAAPATVQEKRQRLRGKSSVKMAEPKDPKSDVKRIAERPLQRMIRIRSEENEVKRIMGERLLKMTPEEKRAKALETYMHAQVDKERKMQEKIDAKMRKQESIAMLKLAKKPLAQVRTAEATRLRQSTTGLRLPCPWHSPSGGMPMDQHAFESESIESSRTTEAVA